MPSSPSIPPPVLSNPPGLPAPRTVLVVDDEKNIRRTLQLVLEGEGYHVIGAETAEQALDILASPDTPVDLAIFDVKLPDMSGLDALERIRKDEAIADTADHRHQRTRDRRTTPFRRSSSARATSSRSRWPASACSSACSNVARRRDRPGARSPSVTEQQHLTLRDDRRAARRCSASSTRSRRSRPRKASASSSPARAAPARSSSPAPIHRLSPRVDGPFVKVNCAAIPRELIESELFGHERGAFTGAQARGAALFEQAHGGTLFLDEIGDMDLVAQAKVLRALQSGEISRVGSEHVIHVDVRVLAATNKDLGEGRRDRRRSARISSSASTSSRSAAPRCASASRTSRCSPHAFMSSFAQRERHQAQADRRRRHARARRAQVARQRARAEERRRAHAPSYRATA